MTIPKNNKKYLRSLYLFLHFQFFMVFSILFGCLLWMRSNFVDCTFFRRSFNRLLYWFFRLLFVWCNALNFSFILAVMTLGLVFTLLWLFDFLFIFLWGCFSLIFLFLRSWFFVLCYYLFLWWFLLLLRLRLHFLFFFLFRWRLIWLWLNNLRLWSRLCRDLFVCCFRTDDPILRFIWSILG